MESQKRYGWGTGKGDDNRADDISGNDRRSSGTKPGNEKRDRKDLKLCEYCGKSFRNLGSHQKWCPTPNNGKKIKIDEFMEKPLSLVISDVEEILKSYLHTMNISMDKDNGIAKTVTLTVRFQVRR